MILLPFLIHIQLIIIPQGYDADKEVQTVPETFLEYLILIGIVHKYQREVPEGQSTLKMTDALK